MRVVIAGGHGKIALQLSRLLSQRTDAVVGEAAGLTLEVVDGDARLPMQCVPWSEDSGAAPPDRVVTSPQ